MSNWITDANRSTTTMGGTQARTLMEEMVKPSHDKAVRGQVGGTHYNNLGIQPLEITYRNWGYAGVKASVYTKVNKYLTRNKGNELEDIHKAIHCLEMLASFKNQSTMPENNHE